MSRIIEKFSENDFREKYRSIKESFFAGKYYKKFLELLNDDATLSHIKWANDTLDFPPIKSMILNYRDFFNERMSDDDKKSLGACFGYLYRFVYGGYESDKSGAGEKITGIVKSARFKKV